MILQKSPIWEVVKGAETFESFQEKILHPICIKPAVPEDIKANIEITQKLLLHSYFAYEFIDVALTHAIFTLEKALKLKHKEVVGRAWNREDGSFSEMIDWFIHRNYFETWNRDVVHQLRHIRNDKVHDEKKSLGGTAFMAKVYSTIDLINDLYEDVELRTKRKKLIRVWQKNLTKFLKDGGIITWNRKRIIIFKADLIFINNKTASPIFDLAIWPIFDLKPYKEGRHIIPSSKLVQLIKCNMTKDEFQAKDANTGMPIIISKIKDDINAKKFSEWNQDFHQLRDFPMIFYLTTIPQNEYFYSSLRKFHQHE